MHRFHISHVVLKIPNSDNLELVCSYFDADLAQIHATGLNNFHRRTGSSAIYEVKLGIFGLELDDIPSYIQLAAKEGADVSEC